MVDDAIIGSGASQKNKKILLLLLLLFNTRKIKKKTYKSINNS